MSILTSLILVGIIISLFSFFQFEILPKLIFDLILGESEAFAKCFSDFLIW